MDKFAHRSAAAGVAPQLKLAALLVGAALAQLAAGPARADSATGVDTTLGNALHPAPVNPSTATGTPDPEGLGTYFPAARTPSGQMYSMPLTPVTDPGRSEGGWEYFGFVEGGIFSVDGDREAYGFRRYKDLDNGPYVTSFGLAMEKPDAARYFEITGGGVGYDDQFYGLTFGRYNDWRVRAFYNETPHVFTTSFRSIYNGVDSGRLTLKPGLTPGGTASNANDNAAVAAVAAANADTEIGLIRKKGGVRLDMNLTDELKFFASYNQEKREGGRPFAAVWGTGGGTAPVELVEPIDYTTHDLLAGFHYNDPLNSLNLQVSASLFRNNIDTLTFETPYRVAAGTVNGVAPGGFTQGRFDLYPDNDAYNIKGEYARRLPDLMNGRFTAVVSLSSSRQDDDLIPYTSIAGVTLPSVTVNNWNSTSSLSRQSADARIDTRLIDLGLALNPTSALNVKAKARYYETQNHTDFLLCNPNASYTGGNEFSAYGCSGVWGPLINDGSGANAKIVPFTASNGNTIIRNIPFDYKQLNLGLAADWRINPTSSANASYERETYDRDHRERDKTWEDKIKLGYINRALADTTLRLSYEHGNRRGDSYNTHDPYEDFYSGYFVPMPTADGANVQNWVVHMNSGLRKFDLADRRQNILNARLNYLAREDLDLGVSLQLKDIEYPADYGRRDRQRINSVNFDVDWQQSEARSIYAFYSWQGGSMKQRGTPSGAPATGCIIGALTPLGVITPDNAGAICQNPASNAVFVGANFWDVSHRDRSNTVGIGLRQSFGKAQFDLSYIHSSSVTEIEYDPPANATPAQLAAYGSGFPDLKTLQNVLEANLSVPISKTVAARLLLRHERGSYRDWHYQGFDASPVAVNAPGTALPTAVVLDAGPQSYRATLLGLLLQIRM